VVLPSRLRIALLIATSLSVVLARSVFVEFDPVRVKLVEAPTAASNGTVQIGTRGFGRIDDLTPPFAIIARVRGDRSTSARYQVHVDGEVVCAPDVAGAESRRVDCALQAGWHRQDDHRITISGPATSWTLDYLELATHHGSTRGYDLVIFPATSGSYTGLSAGGIALAWIALAIIFALPKPPPLPRWARLAYKALAALMALLFVLTVASRYVSPYGVLLSGTVFIQSLVVLLAPRLWFFGRWLHRSEAVWIQRLACVLVAALVLALYGTVVASRLHDSYRGNYSGFLQLSREWFDRNPIVNTRDDVRGSVLLGDHGGYDGQYMYFMMFDPFMRLFRDRPATYGQFIDAPPYRFGRIGFVLLTKVVSGDRWRLYPVTMIGLILGALFVCALALSLIANVSGGAPWWGALIIAVPGFWHSVQVALPEPIAAALLLAGYLCVVRGKWLGAGLLFALALLIRETGAIFVACVTVATLQAGQRREALRFAALSLTPMLVWKLYVGTVLFPDWGIRGFFYNPDDVGIPFAGVVQLWDEVRFGHYYPGIPDLSRAAAWYPIVLIAGALLAVTFALTSPSAVAFAAVVYAGVAVSLKFASVWILVGNAERVTFEMFVTLALLSTGMQSRSRALRASVLTFWAGTALYVFAGSYQAEYLRDPLLKILG
jgi:hypothetical protein